MSWAVVIKNHVQCKGKGFFRVLLPVLIVSVSLAVPKEARETGTALLEDGRSPAPHYLIFSSLFISLCLLLLPPSFLLLSVTWFLCLRQSPSPLSSLSLLPLPPSPLLTFTSLLLWNSRKFSPILTIHMANVPWLGGGTPGRLSGAGKITSIWEN